MTQWLSVHHTAQEKAGQPVGRIGMGLLRYSINITLDGCCDHQVFLPGEAIHRHAAEAIAGADALLFGRVTYELMETGWRSVAETRMRPEWLED